MNNNDSYVNKNSFTFDQSFFENSNINNNNNNNININYNPSKHQSSK